MSKLSKAYFPNTFLRETFALIPIVFIKYDFTYVNATLFITTYVFLLIFTMTDITSLMLDCRLIIIYCIVSLSLSMIYPVAFLIISMTTHIFYFLFRAYIGYGDVLLISALSLFSLSNSLFMSFYLHLSLLV